MTGAPICLTRNATVPNRECREMVDNLQTIGCFHAHFPARQRRIVVTTVKRALVSSPDFVFPNRATHGKIHRDGGQIHCAFVQVKFTFVKTGKTLLYWLEPQSFGLDRLEPGMANQRCRSSQPISPAVAVSPPPSFSSAGCDALSPSPH